MGGLLGFLAGLAAGTGRGAGTAAGVLAAIQVGAFLIRFWWIIPVAMVVGVITRPSQAPRAETDKVTLSHGLSRSHIALRDGYRLPGSHIIPVTLISASASRIENYAVHCLYPNSRGVLEWQALKPPDYNAPALPPIPPNGTVSGNFWLNSHTYTWAVRGAAVPVQQCRIDPGERPNVVREMNAVYQRQADAEIRASIERSRAASEARSRN